MNTNVVRAFRQRLTEYVKDLQAHADKEKLKELAIIRKFEVSLLEELGIFYIDNPVELLNPEFFGDLKDFGIINKNTNKPIFSDRFIIPLYDMEGLVMGLVGYSYNSKVRYMYATTKYFLRNDILYGMENYKECIKDGYIIVTEGITDAITCKQEGFKHTHSTAGAHQSVYMMQLLDFIPCVIFIPDRDHAGKGTERYWKTHNFVRVLVPFTYKDINEYLTTQPENREQFRLIMNMLIDYVKAGKNRVGEEIPLYR